MRAMRGRAETMGKKRAENDKKPRKMLEPVLFCWVSIDLMRYMLGDFVVAGGRRRVDLMPLAEVISAKFNSSGREGKEKTGRSAN